MAESVTTHIITQGLLIECNVVTRGLRVLELLNDPTTDYISLHDFKAYRIGAKTPIRTSQEAIVRKDNINFIVLDANRHETPERRAIAYAAKDQYEVFLTVRQYGIQGRIHMKGTPDPIAYLKRDTGMFLPVTDAQVFLSGAEPTSTATQTVIINKEKIDLFQLSNEMPPAEDLLKSIRQMIQD